MLTSSMPGIVLTPSLFKVLCNLLSSVVVVLCTAFFFLNTKGSLSFLKKSHTKKGKVKFVEKQENCNNKAAAKPHNTELPRQSTAASNPKNTRATKEKRTAEEEKRETRSTYLLTLPLPPVRTALAIFMSFSLFMVASDGVLPAQEKKACTEKERSVAGERRG